MCKVEIGRVGYHPKGYYPYRCDRNVNSPLRNIFVSKDKEQSTREDVCNQFSEYFTEKMSQCTSEVFKAVSLLLRKARSGEFVGIYLQCHCYPIFKPCHCETIKNYIEEEMKCQK